MTVLEDRIIPVLLAILAIVVVGYVVVLAVSK